MELRLFIKINEVNEVNEVPLPPINKVP